MHTKGPWEVRADWIVGMNGTLHVATIPRAFDGDYSESNAALIASAPELYEAGKALSEFAWTAVEADCVEAMEHLNGLINILRNALAKAEGK